VNLRPSRNEQPERREPRQTPVIRLSQQTPGNDLNRRRDPPEHPEVSLFPQALSDKKYQKVKCVASIHLYTLTAAEPPAGEIMFVGGRQQGWQSQRQQENCPKLPGENAPR